MYLKKLRERRGLTQRQLAEKSGVNYRSLQDYEQGHKKLGVAGGDTLLRLSCALGCSVEELLWDVSDAESSELMPQNDVSVDTILAQRFYSEKHRTYGRWLCGDGRICICFVYDGEARYIPFRAIITEKMLPWVREAAALLMEAAIEDLEFERRWVI